jgi:hypothetical protein
MKLDGVKGQGPLRRRRAAMRNCAVAVPATAENHHHLDPTQGT